MPGVYSGMLQYQYVLFLFTWFFFFENFNVLIWLKKKGWFQLAIMQLGLGF